MLGGIRVSGPRSQLSKRKHGECNDGRAVDLYYDYFTETHGWLLLLKVNELR